MSPRLRCLIGRVRNFAGVKGYRSLTMFCSPGTEVSLLVFKLFAGVTFNMSMVLSPSTALIIDITIAYHPVTEIPPTLYRIFSLPTISPYYKFHDHVRRYEIKEVSLSSRILLTKVTGHTGGVESMAYGSLDGER